MEQTTTKAVPVYQQITACRACGSGRQNDVLSLGDQYIVNFPKTKDLNLPQAPLILVMCNDCGLVQLRHSVTPSLLWGEQYWYRSSINQSMRDALADVVREAANLVSEGTWLDIGANDGWLLSRVPSTFRKLACEPSAPFRSDLEEHADKVVQAYFKAEHIGELCDVITSCACFYDVDDPNQFIQDIKKCLSPDGIWVNQFTGLGSMLQQNAFDNICHEHRCYYDLSVVQRLYARNGLAIVKVTTNDVNGGSLRIIAKHAGTGHDIPLAPPIDRTEILAFAERVRRWKQTMQEILDAPGISYNSQWCYGASTKGIVLMQYLDRSDRFLAVADRNPAKHGLYMVGSWLPIVSEAELRIANPHTLFVLPWGFSSEFIAREAALRSTGTRMIFPLPDIRIVL